MAEDALTIRQAAALLGCHPNTVRNRIKSGVYQADKVQTENGETYLIPRSELSQASLTNSLVGPSQSQPVPNPLPDVREAMRAMLEPFVEELGAVREELGRERERRERAEERAATFEAELQALREARESPVSPGPETPTPASGDAQEAATQSAYSATLRPHGDEATGRPWWRRIFGG